MPRDLMVRIVHEHTKQVRKALLGSFDIDSPTVTLHLGALVGAREFSLNNGYGKAVATSKEAAIRDWRIEAGDLETLRDLAREQGKKIRPCGKSPGRPRQPKRGPKPHPKQLSFGDKE